MIGKASADKQCLRILVSNRREEEAANVKRDIFPFECARNNSEILSDFSAYRKSGKDEHPCMKSPPDEQHPARASKNPATIRK